MAAETDQLTFPASLEGWWYTDPAIFAAEQRTIYGGRGCASAAATRSPSRARFIVREVGGESIIVLRTEEGAGGRVLQRLPPSRRAPADRAGGVCKRRHPLPVPRLGVRPRRLAARRPEHARLAPRALAEPRSPPVAVEERLGCLWINMADEPGSWDDDIGRQIRTRMGSDEFMATLGHGDARHRHAPHVRGGVQLEADRRELQRVLPLPVRPPRADDGAAGVQARAGDAPPGRLRRGLRRGHRRVHVRRPSGPAAAARPVRGGRPPLLRPGADAERVPEPRRRPRDPALARAARAPTARGSSACGCSRPRRSPPATTSSRRSSCSTAPTCRTSRSASSASWAWAAARSRAAATSCRARCSCATSTPRCAPRSATAGRAHEHRRRPPPRPSDLTREAIEALREMIVRRAARARRADPPGRAGEPARPVAQPAAPGAERARDRGARHARAAARLLRGADERRPPVADLPHARAARDRAAAHRPRCPTAPSWQALAARNDEIAAPRMADGDVARMLVANRAFHFGLFELSPLGRDPAGRRAALEHVGAVPRARTCGCPTTRRRIIREHEQMLAALARGDRAAARPDRRPPPRRRARRGHRAARRRGRTSPPAAPGSRRAAAPPRCRPRSRARAPTGWWPRPAGRGRP